MSWNPRFVLYAKAHGNAPEVQLELDRTKWSGGCIVGFMLWIADRKSEFKTIHPEAFIDWNIYDHSAWDAYLREFTKKGKHETENAN